LIDKVKKIIKSVDEIEDCKKELISVKKEMLKGLNYIKDIGSELKQLKENQEKENKELISEKVLIINNLKKVSDDFNKELNDFKLIKTKLKTDVVEKVSLDIRKELSIYIMNIKDKINQLNEAANEIENVSKNTGLILEEIKKFKQISSEIKKEDFELSKFANELRRNDSEKLNLMKKIDMLEKLVSKMRRQSR
jgi:uncharacterized coiled-coil DUF342 family protein